MKNNDKFLLLGNCLLVILITGMLIKLHSLSIFTFTLFLVAANPLHTIINYLFKNRKAYKLVLSSIILTCVFFGIFLILKNNLIGTITMLIIASIYSCYYFYKKDDINMHNVLLLKN